MKAFEIVDRLEYEYINGNREATITGIATDNRRVNAGCAFICIKGARFDTHSVFKQIVEAGAALIVVSSEWAVENRGTISQAGDTMVIAVEDTRLAKACIAAAWYGHPADKLITVGITGSKGKTTTTHMLSDMISAAGFRVGTIGTNGAIIGDEIHELNNTTPDSEELQMYLAKMVEAGCKYAVIECSSQGLMQHRVSGFTFDYGIFTNIAEGDHVGPNEHASFEDYLYCKSILIRNSRVGVVNCDDAHVRELLEGVKTPVLFYGEDGNRHGYEPDYLAVNIGKTFEDREPGTTFSCVGALTGDYNINLPGEFNVGNAMAALIVADKLGIKDEAVKYALTHLHIKGRIDMIYRGPKLSVCVDFAHNGYSTKNLLIALREYRPRRLVCVFGADGNRAISRRTLMGEASAKFADLSIVTSGHNRWETFEQIFKDIKVGLMRGTGQYIVIPDRKEAIRYAIENAKEGDLITIIGLGHETYQEAMGVKMPYSDTEYTLSVLKEFGYI
ncbi:MAG: UDP-N-acetylmuramoyl-L-alanyl-D-glutamate--2,6-diaminopimelate ligase [Lachnospiraceae bacterium]|nr:UDP-N-acetylmuramoyl-L-alanyl-D-glutamate--2,6-diaminopimelate ligase [Lachnospiraceae bacterium]